MKGKPSAALPLICLFLAISLVCCGDQRGTEEEKGGFNFIVIVLDALRADHLTCYGYSRDTSPNIDKFADENVLFSNAYSTATATPLAHYSLFTGTSRKFEREKDYDESLIRILNKNGYYTLGVSANSIVSPASMGVVRPFQDFGEVDYTILQEEVAFSRDLNRDEKNILETYHAESTPFNRFHISIAAENINEIIFRKLKEYLRKKMSEQSGKPLFLFINYLDAHDPYFPREPFRSRFDSGAKSSFNGDLRNRETEQFKGTTLYKNLIDKVIQPWMINFELDSDDLRKLTDLYDAEIAYMDHHLGELFSELKQLGLYENSAIFILADHGELLGEYNLLTHSLPACDELLRIPLIVRIPGAKPKKQVLEEEVMITDIKPTVLELLRIKETDTGEGTSLLTLIKQGKDEENPIFTTRSAKRAETDGIPADKFIQKQLFPEGEETGEMRKRLKALGYIN